MKRVPSIRRCAIRLSAALLASASIASLTVTAACAQDTAVPARDFAIPPQPLVDALRAYSQATGIQIVYASAVGTGVTSPGVSGSFVPAEALSRLLTGTGLTYRFTGPNAVTLDRAPQTSSANDGAVQLGPVRVEAAGPGGPPIQAEVGNLPPAYAGGQVAQGGKVGMLGTLDTMNTPFSVTQYTAKLVEDQQAQNLGDVLVNDPSIRNTYSRGSGRDEYNIRGFTLFNYDVAFNGLYGISPRDSSSLIGIERVEVLRGPNALLNGIAPFGSIGGAINLVPKRAGADPLNRFTLSFISDSQVAGQADLSRRFGAGDELGVRVNGIYSDGDTPVDKGRGRLGSATLGLDYQAGAFRVEADVIYQHRLTFGRSGLLFPPPATIAIGRPPEADEGFFPAWSYWKSDELAGALRAELDIASDWTLFAAGGMKSYDFESLQVSWLMQNAAGLIAAQPSRLNQDIDTVTGEAGLRGRFRTGGIGHQIVVSGSFNNTDSGEGRIRGSIVTSNLYNAIDPPRPDIAMPASTPKVRDIRLRSVALTDTLSAWEDRVQLTAGLRHQQVIISDFNASTGARTNRYDKSAWTPTVALLVKPAAALSLYANYIQGLAQGPTAPTTAINAGEIFPPFKSEQIEAGLKYDLGSFTGSLGLFQIERPNGILVANGMSLPRFVLDGNQRNRGIELLLSGEPAQGIRLLGGAALTDGELTRTQDSANDGKTAPAVPKWQINLAGEWDTPFLPGFTLTGRMLYTSSQFVNAANTQKLPGWTRFDLGARYAFDVGEVPVTVRATIENLFDRNYWLSAAREGLTVGAPLTALLSVSLDL